MPPAGRIEVKSVTRWRQRSQPVVALSIEEPTVTVFTFVVVGFIKLIH
jgi:hypothetical protein